MTFQFRPAVREEVGLILGFAGGTGSGKTYSALRVAKGLTPEGQRFALIDTENGRAKFYADEFSFDHGDLRAPFSPSRYTEAIAAADKAGYPVIVVDSASHEWAGDGGCLDMQEAEFQRMGGRESVKMASWIKPKLEHKEMVTKLLQVKAHLILCFRAEPKVEMIKDANGRTQVVAKESPVGLNGWLPISEKSLPFELSASFLLMADRPGVPNPIKLPAKLQPFVPTDRVIDESVGIALRDWARGITQGPAEPTRLPSPQPSPAAVNTSVAPAQQPVGGPASEAVLKAFRDKLAELGIAEEKALSFAEWDALEGHSRDELTVLLQGLKATLPAKQMEAFA